MIAFTLRKRSHRFRSRSLNKVTAKRNEIVDLSTQYVQLTGWIEQKNGQTRGHPTAANGRRIQNQKRMPSFSICNLIDRIDLKIGKINQASQTITSYPDYLLKKPDDFSFIFNFQKNCSRVRKVPPAFVLSSASIHQTKIGLAIDIRTGSIPPFGGGHLCHQRARNVNPNGNL